MSTPTPDLPAEPQDGSALFDADSSVPLGPGDPRPGRAPDGPTALVIDPDAVTRSRLAADLATEGYIVWTCPGPCGATQCPGRDGGGGGQRCPRVPADVGLVAVDQASARTRLLDAYALWARCAHRDHRHPRPAERSTLVGLAVGAATQEAGRASSATGRCRMRYLRWQGRTARADRDP